MLPPRMNRMKDYLEKKGISKRTIEEDRILEELKAVDDQLDRAEGIWTESVERYSKSHGVLGTPTDSCPTCGRGW